MIWCVDDGTSATIRRVPRAAGGEGIFVEKWTIIRWMLDGSDARNGSPSRYR